MPCPSQVARLRYGSTSAQICCTTVLGRTPSLEWATNALHVWLHPAVARFGVAVLEAVAAGAGELLVRTARGRVEIEVVTGGAVAAGAVVVQGVELWIVSVAEGVV